MLFYPLYFSYLKRVNAQRIRNPEKISLDNLFALIKFPDVRVQVEAVAYLLNELKSLHEIIIDEQLNITDAETDELHKVLAEELNTVIEDKTSVLTQSLLALWYSSNPDLTRFLVGELLGRELLVNNVVIANPFEPQNDETPILCKLRLLVLRRALILQLTPLIEWYHSLPELQEYMDSDKIMDLALNDLARFQILHVNFPGFLVQKIRNYSELRTYCQLLPNTFHHILHHPYVQHLVSDIIAYVNITEYIVNLSIDTRVQLAANRVGSLDDLVRLTAHFVDYVAVIGFCLSGEKTIRENIAGRFIQTTEDLYRLKLDNLNLYYVVYQIPRFRALVDATLPNRALSELLLARQRRFLRNEVIRQLGKLTLDTLHPDLISLGQIVSTLQFDPQEGYYSNGTIAFANSTSRGHFSTEASMGYGLAIALSYRAFEVWCQLGTQSPVFEILECGAGDGSLCLKMFEFIEAMAQIDANWAEFYPQIHYTIIELSQALVHRQQKALQALIQNNKVEVLKDDALEMRTYPKKASFHISNELMDMLPSEIIFLDARGQVMLQMAVPMLRWKTYAYLLRHHPEQILDLDNESRAFLDTLTSIHVHLNMPGYPLTASRFKRLLSFIGRAEYRGSREAFDMFTYSISVHYFPDIENYLVMHDEILTGMHPGDSKIICPKLDRYVQRIEEKTQVSIVIDYGDVTYKLKNQQYRSFGDSSILYKYMPFIHLGKRDITFDVDISALSTGFSIYAPKSSLDITYLYGLLPHSLIIPPQIRSKFPREDEQYFRQLKFFSVVYVKENTKVSFPDLKRSTIKPVWQNEFFKTIESYANRIVDMKNADMACLTK